ncbi:MAG: hypothetical protein KGL39_00205 [Patescibacteria group bacterium]|nr:hypothetical protein [Patescibacteria group bacterium]
MRILDPTVKPDFGAMLDPEHPLCQGLVRYWLFAEGSGLANDLVGGGGSVSGGYFSGPFTWGAGPSASFNGSTGYGDSNNDSNIPTGGASTLMVGFQPTNTAATYDLLSNWNDTPAQQTWRIQLNTDGTVTYWQYGPEFGGVIDLYSLPTVAIASTSQINQIITTNTPAPSHISPNLSVQLNGVYLNGVNFQFAQADNGPVGVTLGAERNGSSRQNFFKGKIFYAAIWNRVLTLGEQLQLWMEPYAMFLPPLLQRGYDFLTTSSTKGYAGTGGNWTVAKRRTMMLLQQQYQDLQQRHIGILQQARRLYPVTPTYQPSPAIMPVVLSEI